MNDYILSVLLGIVEGLTEFLPVSSTAHLRLVEAMLHVDLASPYWKMYTIVIQLGAILALVLLFTGRILEFFRTFPRGENGDRTVLTHPLFFQSVLNFFSSPLFHFKSAYSKCKSKPFFVKIIFLNHVHYHFIMFILVNS